MTSTFPTSLDALAASISSTAPRTGHTTHHNSLASAVNAIESFLIDTKTSGRVPFGTGSALTVDSSLAWNNTTKVLSASSLSTSAIALAGALTVSGSMAVGLDLRTGTFSTGALLTPAGALSGFGTATPNAQVTIYSTNSSIPLLELDGDGINGTINLHAYGATSSIGGVVFGRGIGGSLANPSATPAGARLLRMGVGGWGTAQVNTAKAAVDMLAVNQWSGSDTSTQIKFSTTPTGSTTLATRYIMDSDGSFAPVLSGALATTATGGFMSTASCAGTPTGVVTNYTGAVATVYDTSANKIWFYNGSWRGVLVA